MMKLNFGAKVAELADAPDLGSGPARGGGSSPSFRIQIPPCGNLKGPAEEETEGAASRAGKERPSAADILGGRLPKEFRAVSLT